MTLIVETPGGREAERDYILGVVMGDFLGLPWRRAGRDRSDVCITLEGRAGQIRLPDSLFCVGDAEWLTQATMPRSPVARWDTRDFADDVTLVDPVVPVIYGDQEPRVRGEGGSISLPVDIFGSSFFMLSRYEERVTRDRDEHDRFPAWASVAFEEGFLERPIVDEYVEILWTAIRATWPKLTRKERIPRVRISHDVDRPSRYAFGSFGKFLRSVAGDLARQRDLGSALRGPLVRYGARNHIHRSDPYNMFEWLMDKSEENNLTSAFYFICGKTYPLNDAAYDIDDPRIRDLIRMIGARGHEIGLHPSYNTYRDPTVLAAQADRLRDVCRQEGIVQSGYGGRMHFLQWDIETTPQAWEAARMEYDSTLGYADHVGYRCGTCQEYPLFDLNCRRKLALMERPLIVMEGTLLSNKYMGLSGVEGAKKRIEKLRSRCFQFGGSFNVLWHNSTLNTDGLRDCYVRALTES